jgi:predicted ArsR family transcriptional regulator
MAVQTSESGSGRVPTRERILQLLRRHGPLSARQLAKHLDLSPVGIRRHLTTLSRDGLVDWEVRKPPRGRPTAMFHLTDEGLETFPRHYDEVAQQAISFLGNGDGSALRAFLAWRNEQLAAEYDERLRGRSMEERASELAKALSEQGFMAEVEATPEGVRICQYNCTVEHVAAKHHDLCAFETALFERLLGVKVVRESTVVSGGSRCATHARDDKQLSKVKEANPATSTPPVRSTA